MFRVKTLISLTGFGTGTSFLRGINIGKETFYRNCHPMEGRLQSAVKDRLLELPYCQIFGD